MRAIAVIPLLLLTCAFGSCQTKPVQPPKVVEVVVEKIVPVPRELTEQVPVYQVQNQSVGEAVKAANVRKLGQEQCNAKLELIEGLVQ